MLINKPQFDLNVMEPGKVFWLKSKPENRYKEGINAPCILIHAEPLEVIIAYFDTEDNEIEKLSIKVGLITDEKVELQPMVVSNDKQAKI